MKRAAFLNVTPEYAKLLGRRVILPTQSALSASKSRRKRHVQGGVAFVEAWTYWMARMLHIQRRCYDGSRQDGGRGQEARRSRPVRLDGSERRPNNTAYQLSHPESRSFE